MGGRLLQGIPEVQMIILQVYCYLKIKKIVYIMKT